MGGRGAGSSIGFETRMQSVFAQALSSSDNPSVRFERVERALEQFDRSKLSETEDSSLIATYNRALRMADTGGELGGKQILGGKPSVAGPIYDNDGRPTYYIDGRAFTEKQYNDMRKKYGWR